MKPYPVFARVDPCPLFLKYLGRAVVAVVLCKMAGDIVADGSVALAEPIVKSWDYFSAIIGFSG